MKTTLLITLAALAVSVPAHAASDKSLRRMAFTIQQQTRQQPYRGTAPFSTENGQPITIQRYGGLGQYNRDEWQKRQAAAFRRHCRP